MKALIIRDTKTDKSTIGKFLIDDKTLFNTLEDIEREVKVYGGTAIPAGDYFITLSWSNRFKQLMPLIYNMPDLSVQNNGMRFDGVRIHWGNYAEDTEGCVLVGMSRGKNFVGNSRKAYSKLMDILKDIDIIPLQIKNK